MSLERKLEARVIHGADVVTWTTNATRDAYARLYPKKATAMHVVRMGFRVKDFSVGGPANRKSPSPITLAYTGRITPEHRDGSRFLDLYASLHNFGEYRLVLAGTELEQLTSMIKERELPNVRVVGTLKHSDFIELLTQSDVLVLLGNASDLQIPGKLFQYIGARKPILYIKNSPTNKYDEVQTILSGSGISHLTVETTGPLNAKAVGDYLVEAAGRRPPSRIAIASHSWDQRADRILELALACKSPSSAVALDD